MEGTKNINRYSMAKISIYNFYVWLLHILKLNHIKNVHNIVNAYKIAYETTLESKLWWYMLEYIMYFETDGPKELLSNSQW